ncbi:MAG: DUF2155 domain-containing protein [Pseudomonadota bacterium]
MLRSCVLACVLYACTVSAQDIENTPLDQFLEDQQPETDQFGNILGDPGGGVAEGQDPSLVDASKARLRGLDTLTNTVNDFEIAVGETLAFKRLVVTLEACRYPRGEQGAEAYAFLRIRDRREDQDRFVGWMLANSPALSALDHPRYDVWVISCSVD